MVKGPIGNGQSQITRDSASSTCTGSEPKFKNEVWTTITIMLQTKTCCLQSSDCGVAIRCCTCLLCFFLSHLLLQQQQVLLSKTRVIAEIRGSAWCQASSEEDEKKLGKVAREGMEPYGNRVAGGHMKEERRNHGQR